MKTKAFDCVEMKRRGAELVQEHLAGMSREQQLEYWRSQTELLRQRQAAVREESQSRGSTDQPESPLPLRGEEE